MRKGLKQFLLTHYASRFTSYRFPAFPFSFLSTIHLIVIASMKRCSEKQKKPGVSVSEAFIPIFLAAFSIGISPLERGLCRRMYHEGISILLNLPF